MVLYKLHNLLTYLLNQICYSYPLRNFWIWIACVVTRTLSTIDDTAFVAAGPGLWNSLLPHLSDADLPYSRFQRSLKTFLFGLWGHGAV